MTCIRVYVCVVLTFVCKRSVIRYTLRYVMLLADGLASAAATLYIGPGGGACWAGRAAAPYHFFALFGEAYSLFLALPILLRDHVLGFVHPLTCFLAMSFNTRCGNNVE